MGRSATTTEGKTKLHQGDRVTYSEGVKINIGDYESRDIHVSFGTDVQDDETMDTALERAREKVRERLTRYESRVRTSSQEFVDFDTKAKLMRPKSKI